MFQPLGTSVSGMKLGVALFGHLANPTYLQETTPFEGAGCTSLKHELTLPTRPLHAHRGQPTPP